MDEDLSNLYEVLYQIMKAKPANFATLQTSDRSKGTINKSG